MFLRSENLVEMNRSTVHKHSFSSSSSRSTTPVRSILKNTRFILTDETNRENITDQQRRVEVAEKQERASPRKIITTMITEEYRRVQRRIIEEFEEGFVLFNSPTDSIVSSFFSN